MPESVENIAAVIDPTYDQQHNTTNNTGNNHIKTPIAASPLTLPDFLEQSSSPVPPYMPIQGTRRNTGNISMDNNKKKKSKDKCTHQ